ncbi:transporter [Salinisphaera sp. T31B1]|uniref:transporter n=1 Tax=Salinisphaera sp. T31B1 TaxID=727963 RepID=UPI0033420889
MARSIGGQLGVPGVLLVLCVHATLAGAADRSLLGVERVGIDDVSVPADRPGFGDNAALVPQGHYVAEGGYRFDDNQGGGSTHTVPDVLLRTGIDPNVELRVGFAGYVINAPGHDGPGDMFVGAKIRLADEGRYTPMLSVIPEVSLPTGDDEVASPKASPNLRFAWGKTLTDLFALSGNLNFSEVIDSSGDYNLETAASLSGGFSLTTRLSSYIEYYGIFPSGDKRRTGRDTHAINGGFAFLGTPKTQFDVYAGSGLNDVASDVFAGVGIAHLW